jgi:hypothetical protein
MAPSPGDGPGERRLDRPPSDRYRPGTGVTDADGSPSPASAGSPGRATLLGAAAALGGAAGFVVLGGLLLVTAGLLAWAVATGWAVAVGVREGDRGSLEASRRIALSMGLAAVAVALGQIGLWLYARTEGGVLSMPDYLGQVFGGLVPLALLVAITTAWWRAR